MQQLILPYANWNDEVRCKNDLKTYLDVTLEITEKQKRFMVVIFYRIMQFIKILRQNETHVKKERNLGAKRAVIFEESAGCVPADTVDSGRD